MPIIVLDGPDGSGKTTLANDLMQKFPGTSSYLHCGLAEDFFGYHDFIIDTAQIENKKDHLVIIDRLWLSEMVYGYVFRKGAQYPDAARSIDRRLKALGVLNIICLPSVKSKYLNRFEDLKKERIEKFSNMDTVWELYHQMVLAPYSDDVYDKNFTKDNYLSAATPFSSRNDYLVFDIHQTTDKQDLIIDKALKLCSYLYNSTFRKQAEGNFTGNLDDCKIAFFSMKNEGKLPFYHNQKQHETNEFEKLLKKLNISEDGLGYFDLTGFTGLGANLAYVLERVAKHVVCLDEESSTLLSKMGIRHKKGIGEGVLNTNLIKKLIKEAQNEGN